MHEEKKLKKISTSRKNYINNAIDLNGKSKILLIHKMSLYYQN